MVAISVMVRASRKSAAAITWPTPARTLTAPIVSRCHRSGSAQQVAKPAAVATAVNSGQRPRAASSGSWRTGRPVR